MIFPDEIHSLFHFPEKKKGLILTQPESAFLYYSKHKLNLITGESIPCLIKDELELLSEYKVSNELNKPEVFHFCYELGHQLCSEIIISDKVPLFIRIKYRETQWFEYSKEPPIAFHLKQQRKIALEAYRKSFDEIMKKLIDGDCYQVNYTHLHRWSFDDELKINELLSNFYASELLSEYAHHTYVPSIDKLILSNSPESLFKVYRETDHLEVHSTPIKGTLKGETDVEANQLLSSKKDIAELNMITDLVRNDLAKIEKPRVKVLAERLLLKVPKLWHLYSKIAVKTSREVDLLSLMRALFPGGSITGAPKKRVMGIIEKLEGEARGHYCGSTLLNFEQTLAASINIRTFEIDLKKRELTLGAGGGITLQSNCDEEYLEMMHKQESLLKVLHLVS